MQSVRRLTVGYTSRRLSMHTKARDTNGFVVRENVNPIYTSCPTLKLSGSWLAEAGFSEGSIVRVEVAKGQLIISLEGGARS